MMKKKRILCYLMLAIALAGCTQFMNRSNDLQSSSYLVAASDQFGDSSEVFGINDTGKTVYERPLRFGGIIAVAPDDKAFSIYTAQTIYQLTQDSNKLTSHAVPSEGGSIYRETIQTIQQDTYYVSNEGFGEVYYRNTIIKNTERLLEVEGIVMMYGFYENKLYVVYNHTASLSEEISDFRLASYDANSMQLVADRPLPMLNDYAFLSGKIMDQNIFLFAYGSREKHSPMLISLDLANQSIRIPELSDEVKHSLSSREPGLVEFCSMIGDSFYAIFELDTRVQWNTKTDEIQVNTLDGYVKAYHFKQDQDQRLVSLGYEGEQLFLYRHDLPSNQLLEKIQLDVKINQRMHLIDFLVMPK